MADFYERATANFTSLVGVAGVALEVFEDMLGRECSEDCQCIQHDLRWALALASGNDHEVMALVESDEARPTLAAVVERLQAWGDEQEQRILADQAAAASEAEASQEALEASRYA